MLISEIRSINRSLSKSPPKGLIGIEIEVESTEPIPESDTESWVSKQDTSLRYHGMEFVSRAPIGVDECEKALNFLMKKLNKHKIIHNSPRTSVHVHYNVNNYTLNQYWTACFAYWFVEDLLFKVCGETREGNLFCLRLRDAEGVLSYVEQELSVSAYKNVFRYLNNNENIRYSALNLCATPLFGSLEVRSMRGVYDTQIIVDWVKLLSTLFDNAITSFKNPGQLFESVVDKGAETVARELLGVFSAKTVDANMDVLYDILTNSALRLAPLALNTNWERFDKGLTAPTTINSSSNNDLEGRTATIEIRGLTR